MIKFNSIDEVKEDYLKKYKGIKEDVKHWFVNKTLCLRLLGTVGNDTLQTYHMNKKG